MCYTSKDQVSPARYWASRESLIDCGCLVVQNADACGCAVGGHKLELDLGAYQISNVDMACDPGLSKEEFDQIRGVLPDDALAEGRLVRYCDYRIGRRPYHELAILGPVGEDKYSLVIHLSCGGSPGAKAGRVDELLEALAPLSRTTSLTCGVEFTYPSRRWSPSVHLPLRLSDWDQPFDEVRGVRLVKMSRGRELEYSAILDRPRNRDYLLSLTFAYESLIEPPMPQRVILEASRISGLLVRPKVEA